MVEIPDEEGSTGTFVTGGEEEFLLPKIGHLFLLLGGIWGGYLSKYVR